MARRARKSGSYKDPPTWMLGGLPDLVLKVVGTLLDLLMKAVLERAGKSVEALVRAPATPRARP